MFSFFKSKKPSPTGEPIPGAAAAPPREDDFIFIERRDSVRKTDGGESSTVTPIESGLYPAIPSTVKNGLPIIAATVRQRSEEKVSHALNGVPFQLAPELCVDTRNELVRIQVNDIMSFVTRAIYAPQYDFSLERSVMND